MTATQTFIYKNTNSHTYEKQRLFLFTYQQTLTDFYTKMVGRENTRVKRMKKES